MSGVVMAGAKRSSASITAKPSMVGSMGSLTMYLRSKSFSIMSARVALVPRLSAADLLMPTDNVRKPTTVLKR